MPRAGGTTARGYGAEHKRERKRLEPIVQAGQAYCAQPVCLYPDRWIPPGSRWALGHNEDRTAWIGPTHAACNQRDGASRGGLVIAARRHGPRAASAPAPWHSREW